MYVSFILYKTTKTGCFLPEGKWWVEGRILITFSAIVGTRVSSFPCGWGGRRAHYIRNCYDSSLCCSSRSGPARAQQLIDNDQTYSHLKDEVLNFLNFLTEFSTMRIPLEMHRLRTRPAMPGVDRGLCFNMFGTEKSQLQSTRAGEFSSGVHQ